MPTVYTHYKFGQDILNKLSKKQQASIRENINYYNMYNQGFDNLYYHFKWQYYRKFGVKCHKHDFDLLLQNVINYIKNNNLQDNSEITNFLYGIINHYTLDTLVHPLINYQVNALNIPHTKIEFMIDNFLYYQENEKWHNKFYKTLMPKLKFNDDLKMFLDTIFEETYQEKNIGKIFNRSHNNGYYIYRYFISDRLNIKNKFYKIIDLIIHTDEFKLSELTFTKDTDYRVLNTDRNDFKYSFQELYDISFKVALKLNKLAYAILNSEKDINDLLKIIKLIDIKNIPELLKQLH